MGAWTDYMLCSVVQVSKLGPDPLRPDDDAERFWARVRNSKKPIGLLLMDQTAVAGVCHVGGSCQLIIALGDTSIRHHSTCASDRVECLRARLSIQTVDFSRVLGA